MSAGLKNRRVLVLRPEDGPDELGVLLKEAGAEVLRAPAVVITDAPGHELDAALARSREFEWGIFASASGVRAVVRRLAGTGRSAAGALPRRLAAVGPSTAASLEETGARGVWVPSRYTTAALAEELPGPPSQALTFRAQIGDTRMEETLRAAGWRVEAVIAYRIEEADPAPIAAALDGGVDAVAITSAAIARAFASAAGPRRGAVPAFCIGPASADAARQAGLDVAAEASPHTLAGLARAVSDHFDAGRMGP